MDKEQYKGLLSDIIAKQMAILGPYIALLKARSVSGLTVDDSGSVLDYSGDPQAIIQELIDAYVQLSGQIVKSTLSSVFAKYPSMGQGTETAPQQPAPTQASSQ